MLTVLGITGPIFFIIFLGFAAVRRGLVPAQQTRGLGIFVVNFALPALLFRAMAVRPATHLLDPSLFQHYAIGSVLVFLLLVAFFYRRHGLRVAAALAVGASLSNSAFMGLPIGEALFGPQASDALAVYVFVENLILVPLVLIFGELGAPQKGHWFRLMFDISSRLMRNPLVLAMILGMTCAEYGWSMSSPVARTVDLLSSASAPTALFYIGCSLAAIPVKKFSLELLAVSLSKLIIHPAAVLIVFYLLPVNGDQALKAAIVNAAMPMATVYPLLGQRYGQEGICSATLVFTTALSFLTLSGTSWLISSGVW